MQANEKGKQARRHLIEQEKKLRNLEPLAIISNNNSIFASTVNINMLDMVNAISDSVALKVLNYLNNLGVIQLPEIPMEKYYSVIEFIREINQIKRYFNKWDILEISKK